MKRRFSRISRLMTMVMAVALIPVAIFSTEAKQRLFDVELMADHEAEAGRLRFKWSARPVVKNEKGVWIYASGVKAPAPTETLGPEVTLKLPKGA